MSKVAILFFTETFDRRNLLTKPEIKSVLPTYSSPNSQNSEKCNFQAFNFSEKETQAKGTPI